MFTLVIGIHYSFIIVLPVRLKIYRSNCFFFFKGENLLSQKFGRVTEVLRARSVCPGLLHQSDNE